MRRLACLALGLAAALGCEDRPPPRSTYLPGGASGEAPIEGDYTPGEMRLRPEVCRGEPLYPDFRRLTEDDLVEFLEKHGMKTRKIRARRDLVYVEITDFEEPLRLRVAILDSPAAAGLELHEAILEHGPGSWGAHRSNLAVLAPIASPRQAVGFAAKSKLACWGVLTMAGLDDTFVVPGGYMEL